jgi:hypothetical protein
MTEGCDRSWEDRRGLVHGVPFAAGIELVTACTIRLLWSPGTWSTCSVNCPACLIASKKRTMHVPPLLSDVFRFFRFKTVESKGSVLVHGVWSDPARGSWELETVCGAYTERFLVRRTGLWVPDPLPLTCLSCLAAGHGDAR